MDDILKHVKNVNMEFDKFLKDEKVKEFVDLVVKAKAVYYGVNGAFCTGLDKVGFLGCWCLRKIKSGEFGFKFREEDGVLIIFTTSQMTAK